MVALLVTLGAACGWVALHHAGELRWLAASAAGVLLVAAVALRPHPDPERWLRGAAGERATAELLDRLPDRKWAVLHDLAIPGHRANIDHLVIGPTGAWAVDTKTTRARVRMGWWSVRIGGRELDSGPTRWEAAVASELLGVGVRPLIALHAEGLRPRGGRAGGVRVVPAGSLLRTLRRGRRRLSRREVRWLAQEALEVLLPAPSRTDPPTRGRAGRG
jgi:Nuclease-related domain